MAVQKLDRKVGEMNFDGLISDLTPPVEVRGRVIAKQATETTYKRGTVFAKGQATRSCTS